jgi:hypothetical protein
MIEIISYVWFGICSVILFLSLLITVFNGLNSDEARGLIFTIINVIILALLVFLK